MVGLHGGPDDNDGIEDIVKGEEGDALVGHVDEPLDPQSVCCGDSMGQHPRHHEESHSDPVHHVPHWPACRGGPLTPVEQVHIGVLQGELAMVNTALNHHSRIEG